MNSISCLFLKTHLRLRESRAQRLGCELPVVIQAAAEFPRRPAPDVATPLGPLGRALRTLAPGAGRDNQHGDVPPAQPEGGLQPFREKTVHTGLVPQSLLPPDRQADRNAQTGAVTRNHQTDMHGRPLGAASQVLPRTRHLHVQFLHPRHVVRRYGISAQQRHP